VNAAHFEKSKHMCQPVGYGLGAALRDGASRATVQIGTERSCKRLSARSFFNSAASGCTIRVKRRRRNGGRELIAL
jgi:hypothetical protein